MKTSNKAIHTKYRPDIDGLRAFAVISVVIFHFFPNSITGGFIGVDIFFVISGYLISTIIFTNLEKGKFSILEFYDRRVRRIFPALIVVLVSSLVFGYFYLIASEYQMLGKHIAGGSSFIANFIFWKENGYFDTAAELKPMLHLWSLAVEEQFYIFWPLLLWAVWNKKLSFLKITLAVAILSFAANLILLHRNPTAAFFLPMSRFWELMVGGALAYIALHRPTYLASYKKTQSCLGFVLIFAGLVFINSTSNFPGWWAILPTMGAFFIISAGPEAWMNKVLLSNKYAIAIGMISYPLYLWHWPILTFLKITTLSDLSTLALMSGLLFSFFLAWITLVLIEQPLRFYKNKFTSPALVSCVVLIITFSLIVMSKNGLEYRFAAAKLDYLTEEDVFKGSRTPDFSCKHFLNLSPVEEEICLANSDHPSTMVIGDSHAMALHSAIYSNDIKADTLLVSGHSCALYPNLTITPNPKKGWGNNCVGIAQDVLVDLTRVPSIKTVVMSNFFILGKGKTNFLYYDNNKLISQSEAFTKGTDFMVKQLLAAGKKVVFVLDPPHLKYAPTECLKRYSFIEANECRYTELEHDEIRKNYLGLVSLLKRSNPNLVVYDPKNLFCNDGFCQKQDGDHYLYNDINHVSLYGSKIILEDMKHKKYLE